MSKTWLKKSIQEWLVTTIVPLFTEKPSDKALKSLESYIEITIMEERSKAADMVVEYEGCDARWIAEEIRRGDYGTKRP